MTRLALLHGNPGSREDLDSLAATLKARGIEAVRWSRPAAGAPLARLLDELDERAPGLPLVAYSFGGFLALHAAARARQGGGSPRPLGLLAPYLVPASPTSPIARIVALAPGLGRWLLGRKAPGLAEAYLQKTFHPEPVSKALAAGARTRLGHAVYWQGALRSKRAMELHPAPPLPADGPPCLWIRGAEDQVAAVDAQRPLLAAAKGRTTEITLEGAGHGLPWTRPDEVVAGIEAWMQALGGQPRAAKEDRR